MLEKTVSCVGAVLDATREPFRHCTQGSPHAMSTMFATMPAIIAGVCVLDRWLLLIAVVVLACSPRDAVLMLCLCRFVSLN